MKLKILSIAALAFALASGAAIAQEASSTDAASQNTEADAEKLGNSERMGAFFTDDTMTTLRTDEEFNTAFTGMTVDEQTRMRDECKVLDGGESGKDPLSPSVLVLCGKINEMKQ